MTGLVLVCHSRVLADAAVCLAREMLHGSDLRIEVAAGLDATTFGTDATAIARAIAIADGGGDGAGVVVLMDLGSAVLSAELALDLIDPALRGRVLLSAAPLVEGLVVAAVAAAGGAGPAEVAREATSALAAKQAQLRPSAPAPAPAPGSATAGSAPSGSAPSEVVSARFEVLNPHGLHARPAARLVRLARAATAMIELRNLTTGSAWVPASSLTQVALLGALAGHDVEVRASGPDADRSVADLLGLAARRFDEAPGSSRAADPARPGPTRAPALGALPAAPGVAVGPALTLRPVAVRIPDVASGDAGQEWHRLLDALGSARADLERVRTATARDVGEPEAAIFDAHLLLLDDEDLLTDVRDRIGAGAGAARAWADAAEALAGRFDAVADPYLRARAADVRGVAEAVVRAVLGSSDGSGHGIGNDLGDDLGDDVGAEPGGAGGAGIVVADDLTPAQAADLDLARVQGLVLVAGSPTGHSAILARARGIPTVVSAGDLARSVPPGTMLALDGGTGELVVDPTRDVVEDFLGRRRSARARAERALASAAAPAVTSDGARILVGANLGSVADARVAAAAGADLAGLVRTEFLFLGRADAPDVDEQVATYLSLAQALGGRRITLRTLDVGGDKPLPYAPRPAEANPFLGVRGIRLALAERTLLDDQLLAIVRTAHETPVSVMIPMVSVVDELVEVRRRLAAAVAAEGRGVPDGLQVGVMVEVPAAALKARSLVPHVDFLSIGTNDLTQYTLAAERGNPAVAALADPLDPGVLALVDLVCRAAGDGPLVAVCGEVAADERAAALLVALGVRELSVAPPAVPGVKERVRAVPARDDDLLRRCLAAPTAAAVRAILTDPSPDL
jgi:multiphosphoryl transfer protein